VILFLKKFFLKLPIRRKILFIVIITSLAVLFTTLLFFIYFSSQRIKENLVQEMTVLAEIIGSRSTAAIEFFDNKTAKENLDSLRARKSVKLACLYNIAGMEFAKYDRDQRNSMCPEKMEIGGFFVGDELVIYRNIEMKKEVIGSILLISDLRDVKKAIQIYFGYTLLAMLIGGAVAFILSQTFSRIIDRPINSLYMAARSVTDQGNYNVVVKKKSNDELGVLVDAFNEMLLQIQIREGEVKEANANLEEKVKIRTSELEKAKSLAERANESKTEFLANMSHELRTPMHAVLSFAEFGSLESFEGEREELHKYFKKIENSGRRLLSLLNNLLDLSKLEAGKMNFNMQFNNVEMPVNSVISELQKLLEDKNLKIKVEKPNEKLIAFFDQEKIVQVFYNLISNAIKFSPYNSEVNIKIKYTENRNYLLLSVFDKGPGIPSGEFESVFDKFVQSSKTNTGAGGTGLGLSICKEIVNGHGGEIWCRNDEEGGAVFSFTLPIEQKNG